MMMERREARRFDKVTKHHWHVQVSGVGDYPVTLRQGGPETQVDIGDQTDTATLFEWAPGDTLARLEWAATIEGAEGHVAVLKVDQTTSGFRVRFRGYDLRVQVLAPHIAQYLKYMPVKVPPDLSRFLLCPMPGQVVRIDVAEGDIVEDGQPLAIVEAMKMENVLKAEKRARVAKVRVQPGAVLAVDEVILEFEEV
ncbi:biotin/lipoyl-containing protein [Paradevosia shaoguanensis]